MSPEKKSALFAASFTSGMVPFMASSMNIALPSIETDFHVNAVLLAWLQTSFLLSSAVFLLPMGKLADIIGRKRIFFWGIFLYTFFTVLCGLTTSSTQLLVLRFAQGLGGAMIFATGIAILSSVFEPYERGKAIGIAVSFVYVGLALGPSLGGVLVEHWGWRSIFLINLPLGLICLWLTHFKILGEWKEEKQETFDWMGAFVSGICLSLLVYGLGRIREMDGQISFAASLAFLVVFVLVEKNHKDPLLQMDLFAKNRTFAFSNLAAFINYSATFAVTFFLSLYLQYVHKMDPQKAGLVLITQPFFMAIFSPLAGRWSDRVSSRMLASIGMGLVSVALIPLALLGSSSNLTQVYLSLVVLGIGFGVFSSPNTNSIMGSVEKRYLGIASATVGTMRLVGQMFSMALALLFISIFLGDSRFGPGQVASFLLAERYAFFFFSGICFLGIFASLARSE